MRASRPLGANAGACGRFEGQGGGAREKKCIRVVQKGAFSFVSSGIVGLGQCDWARPGELMTTPHEEDDVHATLETLRAAVSRATAANEASEGEGSRLSESCERRNFGSSR